jgi:hypothetical protein
MSRVGASAQLFVCALPLLAIANLLLWGLQEACVATCTPVWNAYLLLLALVAPWLRSLTLALRGRATWLRARWQHRLQGWALVLGALAAVPVALRVWYVHRDDEMQLTSEVAWQGAWYRAYEGHPILDARAVVCRERPLAAGFGWVHRIRARKALGTSLRVDERGVWWMVQGDEVLIAPR